MKFLQHCSERARRLGVRAGLTRPRESSLGLLETELDGQVRQRRWAEVERVSRQILQSQPHHRVALNQLARALAVRGKLRERLQLGRRWLALLAEQKSPLGLAVVEACLRLEPTAVDLRETALALALELRDEERAILYARELASQAVESGRSERALELLRRSLDRMPDEPELVLALAEVHLVEGHVQVARAFLRRAATRMIELGRDERAIEVLQRKLLLAPDSILARLKLGQLYARQGVHARAAYEFRQVLQHDLDHPDALAGLASVCYEAGWLGQAVLAYRRWLELRPGDLLASHRLADALTRLGEPSEALPHWLAAARAYQAEGQAEKAAECLDGVLEQEPGNEAARKLLALIASENAPARPRQRMRRVAELRASPRAGGSIDCDFGDGLRLRQLRLSLPEPSSSRVRNVWPEPGEPPMPTEPPAGCTGPIPAPTTARVARAG
ncbi:MAG: hypothetical protein AMXMBFR33_18060 [Candidatus Xenobia bacterium]